MQDALPDQQSLRCWDCHGPACIVGLPEIEALISMSRRDIQKGQYDG